MAQNWKTMSYADGNVAVTDLQNFEYNFSVLQSNFSGTSAPSATVAGQTWFDTTNKIMKIRNAADNGWQGLMYGSANLKFWAYKNSAPDGFVHDSSITDKIVGVEGGSTYTTAGSEQGSWTMSGITGAADDAHNHQWYRFITNRGYSYDSNGDLFLYEDGDTEGIGGSRPWYGYTIQGTAGTVYHCIDSNLYTKDDSHPHSSVNHTSSWRPAAAVGIIIYPNI